MTEREKFETWFNDEIRFTKESINATQEQFEGIKNFAKFVWQAATKAAVPEGYSLISDRLLSEFPELNQSNYSQDEVDALNQRGIDVIKSAVKG